MKFVAVVALSIFSSAVLSADTVLPVPRVDMQANSGGNACVFPSTCYSGPYSGIAAIGGINSIGDGTIASSGASLAPDANVSVTALVGTNSNGGYGAAFVESDLYYDFEVVGPGNVSVPIILAGVVNLTADGAIGYYGGVNIGTAGTSCNQNRPTGSTYADSLQSTACNFTLAVFAASNSAQEVILSAYIQALGPTAGMLAAGSTDQNVWLMVDPVISIDPSFSDADQFSLVLSPGVGNSGPSSEVPEPGSLALLGTAAAGMGVRRLRRRVRN